MNRNPENELLLCVARRDDVRPFLNETLDWDYVLTTAYAHGLLPLLHKSLLSVAGLVPVQILSRLKRETVANSQNVLHLIAKQLRVYKSFKENEIAVALFKGPLLAQMAYGEISLRQAGDIDVLIHRRDFDRARVLLESLGYEMSPKLTRTQLSSHLNSNCEIQFMRDEWFTVVDLHWELAPGSFVFKVRAEEVLSRLQTVSLAGTAAETFGVEDSILYQSMHGAKHLWRRVEWIVSLAETLRAAPALDWEIIVDHAAKARATRIFALGLRLVQQFSDVKIPAHIMATVDPDRDMQRMAKRIREQIFVTYGPADSTETNLYNLRVMDRKRDALLSALRAIFVPTLSDWQALALPAPLHSLYYAYRPLRLSKVYGTSLWRKVRRTEARNA